MTYVDCSPDVPGMIRFLRHMARTDRPQAIFIISEGWSIETQDADNILDAATNAEALVSLEERLAQ